MNEACSTHSPHFQRALPELNVAVTDLLALIVTVQTPVPLHPSPLHPAKTPLPLVVAVSVTVLSVVNAALRLAYNSYASVAVLISQRLIGIKSFQEQAAK